MTQPIDSGDELEEVFDYEEDTRGQTVVNVAGEWIDTDKVEFLGIAEGMQGEDVLTFKYEGKVYERTVYGR